MKENGTLSKYCVVLARAPRRAGVGAAGVLWARAPCGARHHNAAGRHSTAPLGGLGSTTRMLPVPVPLRQTAVAHDPKMQVCTQEMQHQKRMAQKVVMSRPDITPRVHVAAVRAAGNAHHIPREGRGVRRVPRVQPWRRSSHRRFGEVNLGLEIIGSRSKTSGMHMRTRIANVLI